MATIPADLPKLESSNQSRRILWRSLGLLRPYLRLTVSAYAALLGTTAIVLVTPQFLRWIVDQGIRQNDMQILTWAVLGLLALSALRGALTFASGLMAEIASAGCVLRSAPGPARQAH